MNKNEICCPCNAEGVDCGCNPDDSSSTVERLVMRFLVTQSDISPDRNNIEENIRLVDATNKYEAIGIFAEKRVTLKPGYHSLPVQAFPINDVEVLST